MLKYVLLGVFFLFYIKTLHSKNHLFDLLTLQIYFAVV